MKKLALGLGSLALMLLVCCGEACAQVPITSGASVGPITFSANTTLTGDVFCTDLTIDPGVTLTTNGFNIYCIGTVKNKGAIQTGFIGNGGTGASESPSGATGGGSLSSSYGGSGGGGGGSAADMLGPAQISGSGGATVVAGGNGGSEVGGTCGTGGPGGNGSTPGAAGLINALIQTWYTKGTSGFLAGGGGGGGAGSGLNCSDTNGAVGGSGAFGIFIQGGRIVAGTIEAAGQNGGTGGSAGGGGGGGGTIVFAYGAGGYVAGSYNTVGGTGGAPGTNGGTGGNGGNGQVLTLNYGAAAPNFTISVSPGSTATGPESIALTGSASFRVAVLAEGGFSGAVTLSVQTGGVSGINSSLASQTVSLTQTQSTGQTALDITASANASTGPQSIQLCGASASVYHCTTVFLDIEPLLGVQNQIGFSQLAVSNSGLCPMVNSVNCLSFQQNFFIFDSKNLSTPSYWAQNIILLRQNALTQKWEAIPIFQILPWNSDWPNCPPMVDTNFSGLTSGIDCPSPGLGSVTYNFDYLTYIDFPPSGWKAISSTTGFLALTLRATIESNRVKFFTSIGQATLGNFSSDLALSPGSFISAGQASEAAGVPYEPQLAIVSVANSLAPATFQSTSGTISLLVQVGNSSWESAVQAPFTASCSSTAEQSSGLLWSTDGSSFGASQPYLGEGDSFMPGTGSTCPLEVPGVKVANTIQSIAFDSSANQYVVTLAVSNSGASTATDLTLTAATLNGVPASSPLPLALGDPAFGNVTAPTLLFPATAGAPGRAAVLRISETYSGGTAGGGFRVILPK